MPAPNTAVLYDFESPLEDALANYYRNVNVNGQVFAQVVTPRSNLTEAEYLITPRLQIRASVLGLGSTGSGSQETALDGLSYWSYYQMGLELTVVTSRNNNAQNHGILRGATRYGMTQQVLSMNNNTVPYYQVADLFPTSTTQGSGPGNDELLSVMAWQAEVFIPPTSFPNS